MFKQLASLDVVRMIGNSLSAQGWVIDRDLGKYTCKGRAFHDPTKRWIYVNPVPDSACPFYQTFVECCNFIPSHCLNCWKVVVKPRTLYELVRVYEFQKDFVEGRIGKGHYCKCGVEPRQHVNQHYGAYFYCKSQEHGLHRYEQVRSAVNGIDTEIPVTLKRYCTEFELSCGPSDKYQRQPDHDIIEAEILKAVDLEPFRGQYLQPDFLVRHILYQWVMFAWDRKDPTVNLFNDDEPIFPPSVTYHEESK